MYTATPFGFFLKTSLPSTTSAKCHHGEKVWLPSS